MSTEELVHKALEREINVNELDAAQFDQLLGGLERMYFARVMNCVDGTGNSDKEWLMLSAICHRARKNQ